ncbi:MAG: hypothetical protein KGI79_00060 [Patescibacteria group bacterium]|nr:hypothetical protein [Patescibacteria group bacterium]MDE2116264.1 hypothetical protein [Patescibacteria group bacterium]
MASLRSQTMDAKYREYKQAHAADGRCVICDKPPIASFKYWKITTNDFPYDVIARDHHMLVPLRHAAEGDLTIEEFAEFEEIKTTYANARYDYMIEATIRKKSIPAHFHLHLIVEKHA